MLRRKVVLFSGVVCAPLAALAQIPVVGPTLAVDRVAEIRQVEGSSDSLPRIAALTASDVLMTDGNPAVGHKAECQPLKGEHVKISAITSNLSGIRGLDVAKVDVMEGKCRGTGGWVGVGRLEMSRF